MTIRAGQARITTHGGRQVVVEYANVGSFLVGERTFASILEATDFCRERHLRVIS
jgi:hypothetical protein